MEGFLCFHLICINTAKPRNIIEKALLVKIYKSKINPRVVNFDVLKYIHRKWAERPEIVVENPMESFFV